MTLYAGNIPVHGILYVLFVDSHGDLLSVDCFADTFFFVAFEAITVRCSEDKACFSYRMWLVTIGAGRNGSWLLFPEFSFDNFYMHFFDPGMTFSARSGDVAGGY
jgi:hypothetical protein